MKILLGIIAACLVLLTTRIGYGEYKAYVIKENVAIKNCADPKIKNYIPRDLAINICESLLNKKYSEWVYN